MYVFRVEHKETLIGPYGSYEGMRKLGIYNHLYSSKHPTGIEEGIHKDNYVYGFTRFHKVYKWFHRESRPLLHKANFVVHIYKVNSRYVRASNRQCTFDRSKATLIASTSIVV